MYLFRDINGILSYTLDNHVCMRTVRFERVVPSDFWRTV